MKQSLRKHLRKLHSWFTVDAHSSKRLPATQLRYEALEPRIALAGDTVPQVSGALEGKIVFTSAGHGYEWDGSKFYAGRNEYLDRGVNEAFGNQDQMTYFADYLLRAGATVVPMRPVGRQLNEVVLDNDSPGVTFSGAWSDSTSSVYYDEDYGSAADSVSYRFASISATESATATYTPEIPEAGFYPVYTWVADSGNRTNQLYRIHDSGGGATEIRVDHRKVGKGWVYLGTYHFDAGSSGSVVISNQSTDGGSVVVADAIRFGNGMGDLPDGPSGVGHPNGSVTGQPREDEASLLWIWRMIGQGNNPASVAGTSNVSAPHLMAEHMNNNANTFGDSVYIGFHSNASGSHNARGAVGLWNETPSERTPNQSSLALYVGRQINQDMQALNGLFENNWSTTSSHTTNFQNFGEIDGGPGAEMDMTIIEVAFHDQVQDAELLRDPKVRDQLARSTYEATIEYFSHFGGLANTTSLPSAPQGVAATTNSGGDITVSWSPGPTGVQGGAATGYRVYVSRDGYGFYGYDEVAGAGAGSITFSADELDDEPYYFKVVAVNSGGESPRSIVAAASTSESNSGKVLIVDGFDRNERSQNELYPDPFSTDPDGLDLVDRVNARYNNSFDYAVQVASAIEASAPDLVINTTSNEALLAGQVQLADYAAVFWILGEESTADHTFDVSEQALVGNYLAGGGQLFLSGSEVGWDLDNLNNGRTFYNDSLKADYVADDAGTYSIQGAAGSLFDGLAFSFDNGSQYYDTEFPDVIAASGGSSVALNYVGGTGGAAGVVYDSGTGSKVVNLAFPFETITTEQNRNAVMARVLAFFDFDLTFSDIDLILDNDDGSPIYTETGSWTTSASAGYDGGTYRFALVGDNATAQWEFYTPFAGTGEISVQYLAGSNRPEQATYHVYTGNGTETVEISQKSDSFTWVSLGSFEFTAGLHQIVLDAAASSGGTVVVADVVRVQIAAPSEDTADFNSDTFVDGRDFLAWQRGFGTMGAVLEHGDANQDGAVDTTDLEIWQQQYGEKVSDTFLESAPLANQMAYAAQAWASRAVADPVDAFDPPQLQQDPPENSATRSPTRLPFAPGERVHLIGQRGAPARRIADHELTDSAFELLGRTGVRDLFAPLSVDGSIYN